ncbi:hypothetical protein [Marinobacter gelidimuriae]|uniref:hypothetical protein n=1 Tax=Marinobacter gelidimuriae TaxID=2739064 RepID=UPI00036D3679|nr:hypothetical protein [Marinobacter gelidimuriae]
MIWPLNLERAAPAPTLGKAAKPNANAASLQASDAADELLLQQATHWMEDKWLAGKQQADKPHPRVLVIDDNFGALTLGLWGLQPISLADSAFLAMATDRSVDVFAQAVVTGKVCPARKKARVVICRKGSAELANWNPAWLGYSLAAGAETAKALSVAALPASSI